MLFNHTNSDNALAAAVAQRIGGKRRAFAKAVLGRNEEGLRHVVRRGERHHGLIGLDAHASHAVSRAAHDADSRFLKVHAAAVVGQEEDVVVARSNRDADKFLVAQIRRSDAAAGGAECRQRRTAHRASIRGQEHVTVFGKLLNRQNKADLFVFFERQQIDNRAPARVGLAFGQIKHVDGVDLTSRREAQDDVMRVGQEEGLNDVVARRRLQIAALAAARLCVVISEFLTLHKAVAGERHNHVAARNKVAFIEVSIFRQVDC